MLGAVGWGGEAVPGPADTVPASRNSACAWLEAPIVWIELLSPSSCWQQLIAKLLGLFSLLMQGLPLCHTSLPAEFSPGH